jgi:hypothetical protein
MLCQIAIFPLNNFHIRPQQIVLDGFPNNKVLFTRNELCATPAAIRQASLAMHSPQKAGRSPTRPGPAPKKIEIKFDPHLTTNRSNYMNMSMPSPSRTLRLSDPRLPLTVSRAAIELDKASRGESVTFDATRRFSQFLHDSLEEDVKGGGSHTVWLDANTVDVMGQALIEFEGSGNVRTVQDVVDHALRLVSEMEKAPEAKQGSNFDQLRRFCVAFGNSLLSRRNFLKHEGPINPHRR